MLYWAVVFLIIALVAAEVRVWGIAVAAAGIAKFLFFLFVVIFLIMSDPVPVQAAADPVPRVQDRGGMLGVHREHRRESGAPPGGWCR